ncbi:MAG: hypothetical protein K5769_05645 [Pseudobutyrivibrio sp.]|nr:hypothetical protein [Pseudobutyrivibrio sp.]
MEKRTIDISRIIMIYIFAVLTMITITSVVTAKLVGEYLDGNHASPDAIEKQVEGWLAEAEKSNRFDTKNFPEVAECIIENENGDIVFKTKLDSKNDLEDFVKIFKSQKLERNLQGQDVYLAKEVSGETAYIHYSLHVDNEWIMLALIVIIFAVEIIIPTAIVIFKIKKGVEEVADYTWRTQQKTKSEMAQIAHDLKTPLTVIRGNADLLMEKAEDEDSKESIQAIINNSERIVKSVLEILEKEEQ